MVYRFRFTSEKYPKFSMDVEIKDAQTFYVFHEFIQDELEYDSSHLAAFHVCNHNWESKQDIVLLIKKKKSQDAVLMDKSVIKNFVKDAHQKFLYCYDLINNRSFRIELMETKQEIPNMFYPVCTAFAGDIPPQFSAGTNDSIFDEHEDDDDDTPKKKKPVLDDFDDDIIAEPFSKDMDFGFEQEELESEEEEDETKDDYVDDDDDDDIDDEDDDK